MKNNVKGINNKAISNLITNFFERMYKNGSSNKLFIADGCIFYCSAPDEFNYDCCSVLSALSGNCQAI